MVPTATDSPGVELDLDVEDLEPEQQARTSHPLDGLAEAVYRRLRTAGSPSALRGVEIAHSRSRPLAAYAHGRLYLAGDNERLRQIQAVLADATDAVDLIAAHALTVLERSNSTLTPSSVQHTLTRLLQTR
jgi:hypothetical protein